MRKSNCKFSFIILSILLPIAVVKGQNIDGHFKKIQELGGVEEYLYQPNGMKVLLVQDNSAPVVTVQVVYSVGSRHEVTGNTGSTHLLEHMNFKGTPTFNKKKGTAIFNILEGIGAQMNATTWFDRTNYFETIPSDKIELALHIEADRMRNSLLLKEDKDAEMTVVRNEFERSENNPVSLLNTEIWSTAYMALPYHHSTIGWRSDIENMPIEVLRDFYNTYYWPDNATLTIIGDFSKNQLFPLVDKYFGAITKAPHVMRQPYTTEPEQLGPRRIIIKKPGQQTIVTAAFKIPGVQHEDIPALVVLSQILGSGPSSVISRTFLDTGIAVFGSARASAFKEAGLFNISLGFSPDKNAEDLNKKLLEMLEKVKKTDISKDDLSRVIAKLNTQTVLSRDGSESIAAELNEAIAGGDWREYIRGAEKISRVTVEDVRRVANAYLVDNQSTTGYFIADNSSDNQSVQSSPSKFKEEPSEQQSKFYFRDPNEYSVSDFSNSSSEDKNLSSISAAYQHIQSSVSKYIRKEIAGIDVVTVKTGAKDFITVAASFPIAGFTGEGKKSMIPVLAVGMLTKGTKMQNKIQYSGKLEKLGVNIRVSSDVNNISVRFKCLASDVDQVVSLMAEQLRYPLFDQKELELLKQQYISSHKRDLTDPAAQAAIAFSQAIYPKGHPNYKEQTASDIINIEAVTVEDLKAFHKAYFGTEAMHLVAVGDVNEKKLYSALKTNFSQWKAGSNAKGSFENPAGNNPLNKVITIPKKSSAELFIGTYTGIERKDKDFLPLYIGTNILGGGFAGRLMQTVRDNDGLTYGIDASLAGYNEAGGYWLVNASFNPTLLDKGYNASMVQINKWVKDGITESELTYTKNHITGSFKVGMATTSGLAGTLLSFLQRGLSPDYMEQYAKEVDAVSVQQVNESIKKYVNLDKLIVIKSGSIDQNGNPIQ